MQFLSSSFFTFIAILLFVPATPHFTPTIGDQILIPVEIHHLRTDARDVRQPEPRPRAAAHPEMEDGGLVDRELAVAVRECPTRLVVRVGQLSGELCQSDCQPVLVPEEATSAGPQEGEADEVPRSACNKLVDNGKKLCVCYGEM